MELILRVEPRSVRYKDLEFKIFCSERTVGDSAQLRCAHVGRGPLGDGGVAIGVGHGAIEVGGAGPLFVHLDRVLEVGLDLGQDAATAAAEDEQPASAGRDVGGGHVGEDVERE